jgi:hypothetical protein
LKTVKIKGLNKKAKGQKYFFKKENIVEHYYNPHCFLSYATIHFPHPLVFTRCHASAMPRACGMLVHRCGFVEKIIIKIIWRKTVTIHNVFKKKNYKAKFLTILILKKIKLTKKILEKNHNKKNERKKNHAGKHCSNL